MPYGIGTAGASRATVAGLGNQAHIDAERAAQHRRSRRSPSRRSTDMGFKATDSQTNFIFVNINRPAAAVPRRLPRSGRHGRTRLPALREDPLPHLHRHAWPRCSAPSACSRRCSAATTTTASKEGGNRCREDEGGFSHVAVATSIRSDAGRGRRRAVDWRAAAAKARFSSTCARAQPNAAGRLADHPVQQREPARPAARPCSTPCAAAFGELGRYPVRHRRRSHRADRQEARRQAGERAARLGLDPDPAHHDARLLLEDRARWSRRFRPTKSARATRR